MNKKYYRTLANLIVITHFLIVISMLCAFLFIFLYQPLRIYSAIWLISIGLIRKIYGKCPLTLAEYKLRKLSGKKVKLQRFTQRLFKKYFNLNFPLWLSKLILTIYFLVAVIVLIQYFFF